MSKPDAVAFHVLTIELKSNSSMECVHKLQNLIKLTEEKMPSAKIIISQATNHSDNENLNRKVNTVNSLINELRHEENSVFSICDNSSLGLNGLVKDKGSLTVWALYAYFSDSRNAAFGLLV